MSAVTRSAERLQLGAAAVLSPSRAAELLPVREADGIRWLRERELVRRVPGLGEVVVWGEVLDLIRGGAGPTLERIADSRAEGRRQARGPGATLPRAGLMENE